MATGHENETPRIRSCSSDASLLGVSAEKMPTGQENDTESIRTCSTDASTLRIRCMTLQVSANSVFDTFSIVQETFEKLVKETTKLLNARGSLKVGTSDKECLRQEERRLRNTVIVMTNNLNALRRCLMEHTRNINTAVDEHGKLITTEPLQIHRSSTVSTKEDNEILEDTANPNDTEADPNTSNTPQNKHPFYEWIESLQNFPPDGIIHVHGESIRHFSEPAVCFQVFKAD